MTQPSGPCPARVMIVGEAPGDEEVRKGVPFVGTSGSELDRMLNEAGILRSTCFVTNVVRTRPPGNDVGVFFAERVSDRTLQHTVLNGKHCLPVVLEGIALLKREIEMCQPDVIIALGNVALWALTGNWGITSWRGSELVCTLDLALDYPPKVIPTYHPALVLRQWTWRQTAVHDLRRAAGHVGSKRYVPRDYDFIIRPDFKTAENFLANLIAVADREELNLAIDIETRAGHLACLGIAWNKTSALCIPFMCVERPAGYWTLEEEVELVWLLKQLLTHPNVKGCGQNFIYDTQYIYRYWRFLPNLVHDTMLSHHAVFSNSQKGLDFLSSMYCERHVYWKDDGKNWDPKVGEDQLWSYNCEDCVRTFEVWEGELQSLAKLAPHWPKLAEVHAFQQKMFWPVLKMMNRGVRSDQSKRGQMAILLQDEIAKREQWFIDVLGEPINPKSPKQMQELFYGTFRQKPIFNRKTKTITCDDEALNKLASREPLLKPLIRKVLEHRSLGVFLSTFVNSALDADGRIRCSYNIAGTETYRFSSSKNAFGSGLNLQNIPSGDEDSDELELPNIRKLFIPDQGNTFFDIDLSSADLRVVTWEADEPEMKEMLRKGLDPYTEVGKEFYRDPTFNKKDPRRKRFKELCHGTHYLGTPQGIAEKIGLSVQETERVQKWYLQKFKKIAQWQEDFKDQLAKRRYVENVFGNRAYCFDRLEGTVYNQFIAWIPQSTVGLLINRAMMTLFLHHPEIEVLLQVHDSLAGQYPSYLGEQAKNTILKSAEIVLPYDDPLIIPVGIKTSDKSWGDCS